MAIAQPLTAFSDRIDDATLRGVDEEAPRIREVHRALDACADESGPQRFGSARRAAREGGDGAFYLMGAEPSPALAALFTAADGARARFTDQLALSSDLEPPEGGLRVLEARPAPCDLRAPMDTYLRMLERDETTSPSLFEGLFEDLEKAHGDGLIALDAGGLSLTDKGRTTILQARAALEPLSDRAMERIDLHAQEVADGRVSLREAIEALGADLQMALPIPGKPDEIVVPTSFPDAGVRIDTALFNPLLLAVSQVAMRNRAAAATLALHWRLEAWGLSAEEAQSILRHDIRCLRALGASLSHGPIDIRAGQNAVAEKNLHPLVDAAASSIPDALRESLAGPRRPRPEPEPEVVEPVIEQGAAPPEPERAARRMGLFRRLLSVFLGRRRT